MLTTAARNKPEIRDLSPKEVEAHLRRNTVGRLAFSFRDLIDIRPLHYAWKNGWLFGRTSPGDKLNTLGHNHWVAFEVDEIEGPLDWESVIVRGTFNRLGRDGSPHDVRLYNRALRAIRAHAPGAFTRSDPLPFRSEVFGIAIDTATGRSSTTSLPRSRNQR